MAKIRGRSVEGDEQHAALRADGTSKQTEGGGECDPYEEWTKAALYERAQQVGIDGRSSMSKRELISALRSG